MLIFANLYHKIFLLNTITTIIIITSTNYSSTHSGVSKKENIFIHLLLTQQNSSFVILTINKTGVNIPNIFFETLDLCRFTAVDGT